MRQKSFMNRKLITLREALKVFYTFMSRNYFTAKKLTTKHRKIITSLADKFSWEHISSILLFMKYSASSYFLDTLLSTVLYVLIFMLFMLLE